MASPEFEENPALGRELLVGISVLIADALKRSGILDLVLADQVAYSSIEFSRDDMSGDEITLFLDTDQEGHHIIILSENPRILDSENEQFELGPMTSLILHKDGSGLAPRNELPGQDGSLDSAAEHIIGRLSDFSGTEASIDVLAPEER